MRALNAGALIVAAVGCAAMSWGALQNLFADYQDSPIWVYLLFGMPWLVLACGAVVAAIRLLRPRR